MITKKSTGFYSVCRKLGKIKLDKKRTEQIDYYDYEWKFELIKRKEQLREKKITAIWKWGKNF